MGQSYGARLDAADPAGPSLAALRWLGPPEGPAIELLDQTRLPAEEVFLTCTDVPQLVDAIAAAGGARRAAAGRGGGVRRRAGRACAATTSRRRQPRSPRPGRRR